MLAELYVCSGLSFVMQCDRQNFKNSIKWLIRKGFNFLQDVFQYILKEVLKYNSSLEHHRVSNIFSYLHETENKLQQWHILFLLLLS